MVVLRPEHLITFGFIIFVEKINYNINIIDGIDLPIYQPVFSMKDFS